METEMNWEEFVSAAESDSKGNPIFLSPYGWKIKEIDGKKYIVAMTWDECSSVLKSLGREPHPESVCLGGGHGRCYPGACKDSCHKVYDAGGWLCLCG